MKTQPLLTRRQIGFSCLALTLLPLAPFVRADALDNWTTNQVSTNWFGLQHVAYGNGRYVAGGTYSDFGALLSSEDGLKWTLRIMSGFSNGIPQGGIPPGITDLKFSEDRFVIAAGPFGSAAGFSTNGINWSFAPLPLARHPRGIAYGAGRYVVVFDNSNGNNINYFNSTDGTTWTGPLVPGSGRDLRDVAHGTGSLGGVFVAVGGDGYAHLSFPWQSGFTRTPNPVGVGTRISYCKNIFISPSSPGVNAISENGFDWTTVSTGVTGLLDRVIYVNGTFYARTGNHLASSSDGTNWTERTNSNLPGGGGIASDGRRFVNVGRIFNGSGGSLGWDSFVYTSEEFAGIRLTATPQHQIILSGMLGRPYRVEYLPSLPASETNPWQTLTNLILPSSPYLFDDPDAPNSPQRFYRAVLLP